MATDSLTLERLERSSRARNSDARAGMSRDDQDAMAEMGAEEHDEEDEEDDSGNPLLRGAFAFRNPISAHHLADDEVELDVKKMIKEVETWRYVSLFPGDFGAPDPLDNWCFMCTAKTLRKDTHLNRLDALIAQKGSVDMWTLVDQIQRHYRKRIQPMVAKEVGKNWTLNSILRHLTVHDIRSSPAANLGIMQQAHASLLQTVYDQTVQMSSKGKSTRVSLESIKVYKIAVALGMQLARQAKTS